MPNKPIDRNRRTFLQTSLQWSFAVTLLYAIPASAALCVDPEELSSTDYQFRKYVKYTEASTTPGKTCGGCAFFKPGPGECGSCQVVGGSINAQGYCTSWEQRK
jgi:hypothetical protein